MSESAFTPGPLQRGYYTPTPAFRSVAEHVAVMRPDGALVAVCGPTGDPASEADASTFTRRPYALLDAAEGVLEVYDLLTQHGEEPLRPIVLGQKTISTLRDAVKQAKGGA